MDRNGSKYGQNLPANKNNSELRNVMKSDTDKKEHEGVKKLMNQ